jgi:hypothetical protein
MDAIGNCRQATPIGVWSVDRHLDAALALAWQGADLLAALPLDIVVAKGLLAEATPILGDAFDKFYDAASAARHASTPSGISLRPL